MKIISGAKAKTVTGAVKGGASAFGDAQKQARETVDDARRQARRQVTRARIAAARARATSRTKASGISSKAVGAAGAAGLVAGYFLDPESGKRRRHVVKDRASGLIRRTAAPEKPPTNDQALAERVESEIFQPADAPKGSVNVNVEHGIVYLRGEVERPDQIRQLIEQAGSVDGVAGVESLLRTP
jgi:osmotically-inducible protein OsmY